MVFYFNATIISLLISGLACLIVGLISLINGYKKRNKSKTGRGWKLAVLGTVIVSVFLPTLIKALIEEENGGDFLSISWFFLLFFLPFVFVAVLVCLIFFIGIGTTSLKEGYTRNEEGKFDVESIVLGYVMLVLGVVTIFSMVMFIGASITSIGESIKRANERHYPSSSSIDSSEVLKIYIYSILHK